MPPGSLDLQRFCCWCNHSFDTRAAYLDHTVNKRNLLIPSHIQWIINNCEKEICDTFLTLIPNWFNSGWQAWISNPSLLKGVDLGYHSDINKLFYCGFCGISAQSARLLYDHLERLPDNASENLVTWAMKRYPFVGRPTKLCPRLAVELCRSPTSTSSDRSRTGTTVNRTQQIECPHCKSTFVSEQDLRSHKTISTNQKVIDFVGTSKVCQDYGSVVERTLSLYEGANDLNRTYLGRRIDTDQEGQIKTHCDYCNKDFPDVIEFVTHLKKITDPQVILAIRYYIKTCPEQINVFTGLADGRDVPIQEHASHAYNKRTSPRGNLPNAGSNFRPRSSSATPPLLSGGENVGNVNADERTRGRPSPKSGSASRNRPTRSRSGSRTKPGILKARFVDDSSSEDSDLSFEETLINSLSEDSDSEGGIDPRGLRIKRMREENDRLQKDIDRVKAQYNAEIGKQDELKREIDQMRR